MLNVTNQLAGQTQARVAIRLASINATTTPHDDLINLPELRLWVDDIYFFGGNILNGTFENNSSAGWSISNVGQWSAQVRTEASRSGTYSLCLRQGLYDLRNANEYIEIWQNTLLTP